MLDEYKMLENTQTVIVGLSGGADSIALTHLLHSICTEKGFTLIAVHINHKIRALEAQRDEDFAVNFCKSMGIKVIVKRVDVLKHAKELKIGAEEAGRNVRYKVFCEVASKEKNSKIATAHTLSDNAETIIMRLISGTGLKGLCGIPPMRGNIIRPLLGIKRAEIEDYCKKNNLKYIVDSSNLQKYYTRNKVRLDLIPVIKEINPDFEHSIERAIKTIREDESYLEEKSEEIFQLICCKKEFDIQRLQNLSKSLKNRVLLKIMKFYTDKRIDQKHLSQLNEIIENKSGRTCIPGNKFLICRNGKLKCEKEPFEVHTEWEYRICPLNILTEIKTNIIIKVISISEYKTKLKGKCLESPWAVDADKLHFESVFRNRRPGDVFIFSSRGISKSIKKIFNELKIPPNQRYKVPILAYKNDIIWIDRIGVSKNYLPTEITKRVAIIIKE